MYNSFLNISRICVRIYPQSFDTAALVNGYVNNHRTGVHLRNKFARN